MEGVYTVADSCMHAHGHADTSHLGLCWRACSHACFPQWIQYLHSTKGCFLLVGKFGEKNALNVVVVDVRVTICPECIYMWQICSRHLSKLCYVRSVPVCIENIRYVRSISPEYLIHNICPSLVESVCTFHALFTGEICLSTNQCILPCDNNEIIFQRLVARRSLP
jgi:hypothetical protein